MSNSLIVPCAACGSRNRVDASRLDKAVCGTCGKPLSVSEPLNLDGPGFDLHVLKSDLPVLVDFWAPWCGPCRSMAPAFHQAAGQLAPHVRLAKVDTQAQQQLGQRMGIQSIPTMVLFRSGREVARVSGAMPAQQIVAWARQHLT